MANGVEEAWTFGFLFETILTRDTWMHRIDSAEATGRSLELTADHDGVLVAVWWRSGPRATEPPTPCVSPGPPGGVDRRQAARYGTASSRLV